MHEDPSSTTEAVIQDLVAKLAEQGGLHSAIEDTERLGQAMSSLRSETWLPPFPIDYLIRKRFLEGASRVMRTLESANIVSVSSQSISWNRRERLFPDILLSSDDGRFAIVEIKKSSQTEREAVTELLGYEHELRNHLPFFSGHSGNLVGGRHKVEAATVKVDGGYEVAGAAEAAGGIFHPLNL